MRRRIRERPRVGQAAAVLLTLLGGLVLGCLSIVAPGLGVVGAAAALVAAVAVAGASPLLLLSFPAVYVARRLGPGSLNMSGADVALTVSALVALPLAPWHNVHVRRVAWAMAAYSAILLIPVLGAPSQRAWLEWAHRASFLFGGLAVGAAVAHVGQIRQAMRLLLVVSLVVSVAAVLQTLSSGFSDAYPLGLQKNFAGALLAMTLVVLFVSPAAFGFNRRTTLVLRCVLGSGLLATQSRGGLAALFIALALWSLIVEGRALRAVVVFPAAALVVVAIVLSIQADTERGRNSDFTPVNARRISYEAALKEWQRDPLLGAGLRYFKAPGYRFDLPSYRDTYIEPHSVWYSTLGESGLVGIAALAVLLGVTLRALRLVPGSLALAAGLVVVAKLAHGMVDIYWVAGTQTLPWLLVGLAVGQREPPPSASENGQPDASNELALVVR